MSSAVGSGVLDERENAAAAFGLDHAFEEGIKSREYWSGRAWMAETRREGSAGSSSTGVAETRGALGMDASPG